MQKAQKTKHLPSPAGLFFILFFVAFTAFPLSAGEFIGAQPAIIALQDIFPGEFYDIYKEGGLEILIPNAIGSKSVYKLNVSMPEQVKPLKGYLPLPDPSWFKLDKDSLVVEPYDTGRVRFYIQIPAGEEYRNQAYQVEIHIVRRAYEKEKTGTTVGLVLGLNLEYFIETSPIPEPKTKPAGILGVAPSQFFIKNPEIGKDTTMSFRVYNGDSVDHDYTVKLYIPPKQDTLNIRLDIPESPGYEWIPEETKEEWIKLKTTSLKVKAGSSGVVTLTAHFPDLGVPRDSLMNRGWEGIVAVVPDAGYSRFVRVKFFIVSE